MIDILGYKKTNYADFRAALNKAFNESGKRKVQIAADMKLNSQGTISHALDADKQKVSDGVLTEVMKAVGLNGFVVWISGKRYYYIKSN